MLSLEGALRFGDEDGFGAGLASEWERGVVEFNLANKGALSPLEVAFMQAHAQNALRRFGYQLSSIGFSPVDTLHYYLDLPFNLARMAAWRVLEARQLA
jgi:hypothetical protein